MIWGACKLCVNVVWRQSGVDSCVDWSVVEQCGFVGFRVAGGRSLEYLWLFGGVVG